MKLKQQIAKLVTLRYLSLVAAALIGALGLWSIHYNSLWFRYDGALDMLLSGFNLGAFFYRGLLDDLLEELDKFHSAVRARVGEAPMTKTEHGYVSPYRKL